MSILYPKVIWAGCIKAEIGNPELESMVHSTVVDQSMKWIESHNFIRKQMQEIQTFTFPDAWVASR